MSGPFSVIYEDEHLLVLNKPSGLLSIPGRGPDKQDCLLARVQAQHPEALLVHRLDMATSGLLIMARSPELQKQLGQCFEKRRVSKRYQAVVLGDMGPAGSKGLIDLPVRIDWLNRPRSIICHEHGKPSQTQWTSLGSGPLPGTTRLLLEPHTGRTHQLRVHTLALGHPIMGDPLYAPESARLAVPRLWLHAWQLELAHPITGQAMQWVAPLPF
jgi:tRNA pseudouridine32 synthase/23S rRNA pseudouridine746 synthase